MALGKCSYYGEKNCKFSHAGVAGSNRDHAVDKQGNCRQFKKHGYCWRPTGERQLSFPAQQERYRGARFAECRAARCSYGIC